MAAPALAASMPEAAICSGVTGTWSDLPTVAPAPVSAHVMMTLLFMLIRSFLGEDSSVDGGRVPDQAFGVVVLRRVQHLHDEAGLDDPARVEHLDPGRDGADQCQVVGHE